MLIKICPIKRLLQIREQLESNNNIAAILCSSYKIPTEKFDWIPHIALEFDDIATPSPGRSFDEDKSKRIREFVDGLPKHGTLYICCDSGESRSAAIAAATYCYRNKDEMIIWRDPCYHPNLLVYKLQCEAYGVSVSRFQLWRRARISRRAFRNAVKGK